MGWQGGVSVGANGMDGKRPGWHGERKDVSMWTGSRGVDGEGKSVTETRTARKTIRG